MLITWSGSTSVEIKTKNATVKTGEKIYINDIELSGAGEFEVSGVEAFGNQKGVFRFRIEDVSVAYLDNIKEDLSNEELDELSDVSIVIIPIGSPDYLDEKKASNIIKSIEPKIVIPVGLPDRIKFCEMIGGCEEIQDSFKITKQELSQEEGMQTVLLESK